MIKANNVKKAEFNAQITQSQQDFEAHIALLESTIEKEKALNPVCPREQFIEYLEQRIEEYKYHIERLEKAKM